MTGIDKVTGFCAEPAPRRAPTPRDPSTPVDVALVVVWRAGRRGVEILLTRRAPHVHLGGAWELPGGKVEPGETAAEAAARELKEETGLTGLLLEPLAGTVHRYPERTVRLHASIALEPVVAAGLRPGLDHRWIALDELRDVPWPQANVPLLEAIESRLRRD